MEINQISDIPKKEHLELANEALKGFFEHLKSEGFNENIQKYLTKHYQGKSKHFDKIFEQVTVAQLTKKEFTELQKEHKDNLGIFVHLLEKEQYFTISKYKIVKNTYYCDRNKVFLFIAKIDDHEFEIRVQLEVIKERTIRGKLYSAGIIPLYIMNYFAEKNKKKTYPVQEETIKEDSIDENKE